MAKITGLNLLAVTSSHVIATGIAPAGPRVLCTKDMEIHDYAFTAEEELAADSPLAHMLTDVRDRKLLEALADLHEQRRLEPIKVGVVYGVAVDVRLVAGRVLVVQDRGYRQVPQTGCGLGGGGLD